MSPDKINQNKSPLESGMGNIEQLQKRIEDLKKEIENFKRQTLDANSESKDQENILNLLQDIEKRVNQFDQLDEDKKKSEIESLEQAREILTSTKRALSKLKEEKFENIPESQTLINKKLPWSSPKANKERAFAAAKISNIDKNTPSQRTNKLAVWIGELAQG